MSEENNKPQLPPTPLPPSAQVRPPVSPQIPPTPLPPHQQAQPPMPPNIGGLDTSQMSPEQREEVRNNLKRSDEIAEEMKQADGDVIKTLDGELSLAQQGQVNITYGSGGYSVERGNERFSVYEPLNLISCSNAFDEYTFPSINPESVAKIGEEVRGALRGNFFGLVQGNLSKEEAAKIVSATLDAPGVCAPPQSEHKSRGR